MAAVWTKQVRYHEKIVKNRRDPIRPNVRKLKNIRSTKMYPKVRISQKSGLLTSYEFSDIFVSFSDTLILGHFSDIFVPTFLGSEGGTDGEMRI